MESRIGGSKRTIIIFIFIGGVEIDARASFQGGEEGGGDVGGEPRSDSIDFVAGHGGAAVVGHGRRSEVIGEFRNEKENKYHLSILISQLLSFDYV